MFYMYNMLKDEYQFLKGHTCGLTHLRVLGYPHCSAENNAIIPETSSLRLGVWCGPQLKTADDLDRSVCWARHNGHFKAIPLLTNSWMLTLQNYGHMSFFTILFLFLLLFELKISNQAFKKFT